MELGVFNIGQLPKTALQTSQMTHMLANPYTTGKAGMRNLGTGVLPLHIENDDTVQR